MTRLFPSKERQTKVQMKALKEKLKKQKKNVWKSWKTMYLYPFKLSWLVCRDL